MKMAHLILSDKTRQLEELAVNSTGPLAFGLVSIAQIVSSDYAESQFSIIQPGHVANRRNLRPRQAAIEPAIRCANNSEEGFA